MEAIQVDDALETLEMFIDRQADQEITKDELYRVLDPVLDKIKRNEFNKVTSEDSKKVLNTYLAELLATDTANGKLMIVVVENNDEEDSYSRNLLLRGDI